MSLFATEVPNKTTDEMIDFLFCNCKDESVEYELREFITTACFTEEELEREDLPEREYHAKFTQHSLANADPEKAHLGMVSGYVFIMVTNIADFDNLDTKRNLRFLPVVNQKIASVDNIQMLNS